MQNDVLLPLEQLQDIGERYSPRVLRQFFQSTDSASIEEDSIAVKEISDEKLNFIRKTFILNVPPLWIGCIAGSIVFASQSDWNGLQDPTTFEATIQSVFPNLTSTILLAYGLSASLIAEIVCVLSCREKSSLFDIFFFFFGGLLSRIAIVLDALSFVLILKAAPQLAFVASPVWVFGSLLFFYVQIRTLFTLIRKDYFSVVNEERWFFNTRIPPPAVSFFATNNDHQIDLSSSAVSCPANHVLLRTVTQAASVFDFALLYSVLLKNFVPVSLQADLVITGSCKAHHCCLNHHLILVPLKYFFLADYGINAMVVLSILVSVLASVLSCVAHVVPVHR